MHLKSTKQLTTTCTKAFKVKIKFAMHIISIKQSTTSLYKFSKGD